MLPRSAWCAFESYDHDVGTSNTLSRVLKSMILWFRVLETGGGPLPGSMCGIDIKWPKLPCIT